MKKNNIMNDLIIKAWVQNYSNSYNLSDEDEEKLIELWTMRACRFFVEANLDAGVVSEDLTDGNLDYSLKFEKKEIDKY